MPGDQISGMVDQIDDASIGAVTAPSMWVAVLCCEQPSYHRDRGMSTPRSHGETIGVLRAWPCVSVASVPAGRTH